MSAHLESAARALREVLTAKYPDRVWTVQVSEGERHEPAGGQYPRPVPEHPDTITQRHAGPHSPSAGAPHDDRLKKTA